MGLESRMRMRERTETTGPQKWPRREAKKYRAAGSQARLKVNDVFYMGGGREGGTRDPPGKITKFRGPEIPLIASKLLVSGGGRGWTD